MASNCCILYIPDKESNTLIGIFDNYEKALKFVKKDFYCGRIPRDESEFNNSITIKTNDDITKLSGNGIPNYIIEKVIMNDSISSVIEVKKEVKKEVKEKIAKDNKETSVSKEKLKEINSLKKDIDSKIKSIEKDYKSVIKEQEKLVKMIEKIK